MKTVANLLEILNPAAYIGLAIIINQYIGYGLWCFIGLFILFQLTKFVSNRAYYKEKCLVLQQEDLSTIGVYLTSKSPAPFHAKHGLVLRLTRARKEFGLWVPSEKGGRNYFINTHDLDPQHLPAHVILRNGRLQAL